MASHFDMKCPCDVNMKCDRRKDAQTLRLCSSVINWNLIIIGVNFHPLPLSLRHWSLNIKNVIIIKTSFRAYVVMHLHFLLVIFDLPSTFSISSSSDFLLPWEMYIKAASTLTHLGIDMAWLSFTMILLWDIAELSRESNLIASENKKIRFYNHLPCAQYTQLEVKLMYVRKEIVICLHDMKRLVWIEIPNRHSIYNSNHLRSRTVCVCLYVSLRKNNCVE